MLIYAHNGYPRVKMGLQSILKSFSTISFAWFYLFIMLGNVEAKIGRYNLCAYECACRDEIVVCARLS